MTEPHAEPVPETLVERETTIAAARDLVWRHWVEPDRLVGWMGSSATVDLRPGGEIRVEYANGTVMRGTVEEVEEPSRLAITWGWEDPAEAVQPGGSRVEVTFDDVGGGTRVLVRHLDLPEDERASHAEGWDYFLARLGEAVT